MSMSYFTKIYVVIIIWNVHHVLQKTSPVCPKYSSKTCTGQRVTFCAHVRNYNLCKTTFLSGSPLNNLCQCFQTHNQRTQEPLMVRKHKYQSWKATNNGFKTIFKLLYFCCSDSNDQKHIEGLPFFVSVYSLLGFSN